MKIFIDTDVIMDFLYQRDLFFENAVKIIALVESKKVEGFISSLIIWNLFYLLSRHLGNKTAKVKIREFRSIINIIPIDSQIIDTALNSNIRDFEDSIQYFAARQESVDVIVARNKKDYPKTPVTIMNPNEFLQFYEKHIMLS